MLLDISALFPVHCPERANCRNDLAPMLRRNARDKRLVLLDDACGEHDTSAYMLDSFPRIC